VGLNGHNHAQTGHGQMTAPAAPKKATGNQVTGCGLIIVLVIAGIIALVVHLGSKEKAASAAQYKASVAFTKVVNPADLAVYFTVKNTGGSAGSPQCTVNASDPSGAYTGFNSGTVASAIQPGATEKNMINVTITSQGAKYVTSVTVTC
jgi:hypothetical protein